MTNDHRHVVVGCGGLGAAALYWLARATGGAHGAVLGLEAGQLGSDRADGRLLGHAQRQDVYAELAPAAHDTWRAVERVSGRRLLVETGELLIEDGEDRLGPATLDGHRAVAARHGTVVEELDAHQVTARWPQFRLAGTERAIHQRHSGVVDVRRAEATHLALARGQGADVMDHTAVRALHPTRDHVEVVTDDGVLRAEQVVVTADALTTEVLEGVGRELPLTTLEEHVTTFATPHLLDFAGENFPAFRWYGAEHVHGHPVLGEVSTTLDQHLDGHEVAADSGSTEAATLRRKRREEFLAEHVPGFGGPELVSRTYRSTIATDRHLVLDTVPEAPRVHVAVGAGYGAAYASLIGRVLAELATAGRSRFPVDTFSLDRPALLDAGFERRFGL
ncbi:FAD-dependent oxidoreductase [Actinomycetospora termitidis]|uniref:FAD-dependent oxidoreductase n=1 Tax=Actinomycetospora termitidis TaxID=3053470 RepID=A0ABT7MKS5_9PSEU|nr:FAD-dependent oxidoreductase [Actinomycetospora sp. Odt1-22]MDL5159958.1 FAD-dependent oxidoreductase [Actinomycetospora sp. Odt1-22]